MTMRWDKISDKEKCSIARRWKKAAPGAAAKSLGITECQVVKSREQLACAELLKRMERYHPEGAGPHEMHIPSDMSAGARRAAYNLERAQHVAPGPSHDLMREMA